MPENGKCPHNFPKLETSRQCPEGEICCLLHPDFDVLVSQLYLIASKAKNIPISRSGFHGDLFYTKCLWLVEK